MAKSSTRSRRKRKRNTQKAAESTPGKKNRNNQHKGTALVEFAKLWLPIIGAGVFIAWAVGAWYGGNRVLAIWLIFSGAVCLLLLGAIQWQESLEPPRSTLVEQQRLRAYVSLADIGKERAIVFATGEGAGWNFTPIWKNTGATPATKVTIRSSGRNFPAKMPKGYAFPEIFDADEIFIGPQLSINGGVLGIPLLVAEEIRDGKQFSYIWGSVEYDDGFKDSPRHRAEFCVQVLMAGDLASQTNNKIVFVACKGHNRTYDIDRRKPSQEYTGPETAHLQGDAAGTRLRLPPEPIGS